MQTILVIEDDKDINNMIKQLLEKKGFKVFQVFSGTEALLLHNENIDLILLDLMLPGKNGEEIIEILKTKKSVPVIVMSAIDDVDTKINLFELGADDYITKPFHNEEMLARIKVQLKNKKVTSNCILKHKDLVLNINDFTVTCNQIPIIFTKNEFEILKILMEHPNQVLTKSILFDHVWGSDNFVDDNTLNVHISKIRHKLKQKNPNYDYIETIWSVGYRMKK